MQLGTTDAAVVAFARGELKRESLVFRIRAEFERRGLAIPTPVTEDAR